MAANEAFFCDSYRNTENFLCSVERIKRFVNVHLHCIVSNIPSKVRKYSGPPTVAQWNLILADLQHSKTMETTSKTRSYLDEMCSVFVFW